MTPRVEPIKAVPEPDFGESEANPVECGSLGTHPKHEFYSYIFACDVVCPGHE